MPKTSIPYTCTVCGERIPNNMRACDTCHHLDYQGRFDTIMESLETLDPDVLFRALEN